MKNNNSLQEIEAIIVEKRAKIKNGILLDYVELLFLKNAIIVDEKFQTINSGIAEISKSLKDLRIDLGYRNGKT
jgi:hypothetical protein